MAKSGMNPEVLQYIMRDADIIATLNTYTLTNYDDAEQEFLRVKAL